MTNEALVRVKKLFLDREKVSRFMDKKKVRAFKKTGGLIRITAKRSMKSRKGPSKPGQPPHKHNGKQLDRLLFYSYDPKSDSVVVGPTLLDGYPLKDVPRLMEMGGSRISVDKKGQARNYTFPERPFMVPAMRSQAPKTAEYMRDI